MTLVREIKPGVFYIYDPEIGDPDSGIAPNTPFEELPDSWTCPQCGASKSDFEELK